MAGEGGGGLSATTEAFFASVHERDPRLPPAVDGSLRFDVRYRDHTEQWLLRFAAGRVRAEQSGADADCVVAIDSVLFEQILCGKERLFPAFIRFGLTLEGVIALLPMLNWLLPDMVGARHPRQLAEGWKEAR